MPHPSKTKGAAFEVAIVAYLRRWWPNACRTLAGARDDRGDISGVPLVLELKNEKRTDLAGWWREAQQEMVNAGMSRAAVIHKRRGVSDPGEQWVTLTVAMLVELLTGDDDTPRQRRVDELLAPDNQRQLQADLGAIHDAVRPGWSPS